MFSQVAITLVTKAPIRTNVGPILISCVTEAFFLARRGTFVCKPINMRPGSMIPGKFISFRSAGPSTLGRMIVVPRQSNHHGIQLEICRFHVGGSPGRPCSRPPGPE